MSIETIRERLNEKQREAEAVLETYTKLELRKELGMRESQEAKETVRYNRLQYGVGKPLKNLEGISNELIEDAWRSL